MLVPPQADLVMLALAGAGLLGGLAYVVRGGRTLWVVIALGAYTLVAAAGAAILIGWSPYTVVVTSDGKDLHGERALKVLGGGKSIVINDTDRTLALRAAVYSEFASGAGADPGDRTIAPHSTAEVPAFIEHIGPSDPFPREVSSETSTTTQYWLTW